MGLFIMILKWILIIILVILVIIFILSLFSITYDIDVRKDVKNLKALIDVKYLFGLFRFKGSLDGGKFLYNIRLLCFSLRDIDKKKQKKIKYKEQYRDIEEKNNLDYIFNDKAELLQENENNRKKVSTALTKNRKTITKTSLKNKDKNNKKKKKGKAAKIFGLFSEKEHKTIKSLFGIIKEIIILIKPEKANFKFTFTSLKLSLKGSIRIINLIIIAVKVLIKKETRELIFG